MLSWTLSLGVGFPVLEEAELLLAMLFRPKHDYGWMVATHGTNSNSPGVMLATVGLLPKTSAIFGNFGGRPGISLSAGRLRLAATCGSIGNGNEVLGGGDMNTKPAGSYW